jgi:hypothetical protein
VIGNEDSPARLNVTIRPNDRFSLLNINLRGIVDEPDHGAWWQDRYSRIADWIVKNSHKPDVIVLQEVVGWGWCPTNHRLIPDYAAVDFLLSKMRSNGVPAYRIAYLIGSNYGGDPNAPGIKGGPPLQGCELYQGLALLYDPERLRNSTSSISTVSRPHDYKHLDLKRAADTEIHLRRSLPCCNPAQDRLKVCELIDGPVQSDKCNKLTGGGVAWASLGYAAFARFELVQSPGAYIHIYNVHRGFEGGTVELIDNFVSEIEGKYGQQRLFPPILAGDFNLRRNEIEEYKYFSRFEFAGFSSDCDSMGNMSGKSEQFSAKHKLGWQSTIIDTGTGCGASVDTLWSDHQSVFTRFYQVD